MTDENILGFDFDNTSDVVLPVSPGIREVRFDEAPKIQPNSKDPSKTNLACVMRINDDKVEGERDKYVRCYYDTKTQRTEIKRVFLACGIKPQANTSLMELVGKTCQVSITHSNVTDKQTGTTKVYANIQEFLVPAHLVTNVPKIAPVGAGEHKQAVPQ